MFKAGQNLPVDQVLVEAAAAPHQGVDLLVVAALPGVGDVFL